MLPVQRVSLVKRQDTIRNQIQVRSQWESEPWKSAAEESKEICKEKGILGQNIVI